jgi:hypothetical protein
MLKGVAAEVRQLRGQLVNPCHESASRRACVKGKSQYELGGLNPSHRWY